MEETWHYKFLEYIMAPPVMERKDSPINSVKYRKKAYHSKLCVAKYHCEFWEERKNSAVSSNEKSSTVKKRTIFDTFFSLLFISIINDIQYRELVQ